MSDDKPVFVQLVELLGEAEAVANEQPVIVITIRPDPPNFWPHNIALTKARLGGSLPIWRSILLPFVLFGVRSPGDDLAAVQESIWSPPTGTRRRAKRRKRRLRLNYCDLSRLSRLLSRRPRNHRPSPLLADKPLNISGNTIILSIRGATPITTLRPRPSRRPACPEGRRTDCDSA